MQMLLHLDKITKFCLMFLFKANKSLLISDWCLVQSTKHCFSLRSHSFTESYSTTNPSRPLNISTTLLSLTHLSQPPGSPNHQTKQTFPGCSLYCSNSNNISHPQHNTQREKHYCKHQQRCISKLARIRWTGGAPQGSAQVLVQGRAQDVRHAPHEGAASGLVVILGAARGRGMWGAFGYLLRGDLVVEL